MTAMFVTKIGPAVILGLWITLGGLFAVFDALVDWLLLSFVVFPLIGVYAAINGIRLLRKDENKLLAMLYLVMALPLFLFLGIAIIY